MNNINFIKIIEKIQMLMSYPIFSAENPVSKLQLPTSSVKHPTSSPQLPPSSVKHPTSSLQLPTSSVKPPASSVKHPTSSFQLLILLLLTTGFGYSQNLQTYIDEAIRNNPSIQAVEKQYAISSEKISEVNSLPDTQFSGGYMVEKTDMPMMQQGEFSVMQMFPWFGTIAAREKYASAMADADLAEIAIAKRKIALALSQSYYRLYEIAKKQQVLDSNVRLLQVYEQMALTSVEVGQASAVSVLRLQMRQNELRKRKLVLEQDYAAQQTVFKTLMNREEMAAIAVVDSLPLPERDLEMDFDNLRLHPELTKFEALNTVVSQADALNKKESAPDLGIGVEYMLYNEAPNMLMPMVTVAIPIFNKKYKSVARQNQLRYEALDIQKQDKRNALISQLETAVRNRNAARIQWQTQQKNLRQAADANEILLKNYETGTIDFREVLDIQELQLQFQLNAVEAIAEYFRQESIINYYIEIK